LPFQWQYAIVVLIFASLQLYLTAGMICLLWQIRIEYGLIIAGLVSFGLAAASSDYSLNLQLSHLPLNHGGNVIMFLDFTWLMLLAFMQSGPTKAVLAFPFLGLLAIASLASLSNKLFVIQAVLPAIFCYAVSTSYGLEGRWHSRTLEASTNWQLWFSSLAENGHASPWGQGKWEFRERFPQRRVSNYMAVIVP
jgi:hypothetical protein